MKFSARNQLKGKIVDVKKGATTAHVRIDIGGGNIVTASDGFDGFPQALDGIDDAADVAGSIVE